MRDDAGRDILEPTRRLWRDEGMIEGDTQAAASTAGEAQILRYAAAGFAVLALAAAALWARHGSTLFVDMLALVTSCF